MRKIIIFNKDETCPGVKDHQTPSLTFLSRNHYKYIY